MKFIILIILILIDFFSKKFISSFIFLNSFKTIFPFLKIVHFQNNGIAFGLFQDVLPPWLIILILFKFRNYSNNYSFLLASLPYTSLIIKELK